MRVRLIATACLLVAVVTLAAQNSQTPAPSDPQLPTFRTQTELIRVDMYATRDGKLVTDLRPEEVEIYEDGTRQRIETFEFVRLDGSPPEGPPVEKDRAAQDSRSRIFVVFVDTYTTALDGRGDLRIPLLRFLDNLVGTNDLVGLMTPDMKASATWLTWTPQNAILFGEHIDGDSGLATVDPQSGRVEQVFRDAGQLTAGAWGTTLSLARDGKTSAIVRSSFTAPPEIWAGAIGDWKPLTTGNAGLAPAWGNAKSIHWKSDDYDVQGWLIYPRNFNAAATYPMVVSVHGGPGSAVRPAWPDSNAYEMALAAAGYFVFKPNPRGSFGQGEAFTSANVKDFGYGDFRDILAGVDEVLRVAPIDPDRLGLTGWSYGGYMTMWGVTQTNRFKAAMAGAGIANYQSYYGQNLIDQWMKPFFGATVYDDPAVYAKSSPITYIKNVRTPTLIVVGDSDAECPAPQSYEFWHALKALGIETRLVVYEHEGHMFATPAHQRDRIERTVAWFDAHLK